MNNFRHHPRPSFGIRGTQQNPDLPNPWMSEEELVNMRRQNPQFRPFMQNMAPNIQSPILNQSSVLPASSKNYINDSSYKMNNSSFANNPNPDIFKSLSSMSESHFSTRLPNDRFSSSNSFPNVNMQYKMNENPMFRDFPGSNVMPSRKNDGFTENASKPFYPNMRQPQERFSCMQNDQIQFHSKYDNVQMFQGKRFPFSSDKDLLSHNTVSFLEKTSNTGGNNTLPYKSNFRTTSLFPAYTPKDTREEIPKTVQSSNYNSDFLGSTSLCDKTVLSSQYSKNISSFQEKNDSFQKNVPEKVINDLFPQQSNSPSYMYDNQSFKAMPSNSSQESFKTAVDPPSSSSNKFPFTSESQQSCFQSPMQQDSFKTAGTVTSSSNKFPFASESQQTCFQSSSESHFQQSQGMQISDHSSTPPSTSSAPPKDCLMQNQPLISQADVNQGLKDNFPASSNCSFNFESNMNTTDIADLLPGLETFLKENFKSDDLFPKNESKGNSAFSDDEWTKPSIPFIGDSQVSSSSDTQNNENRDAYCGHSTPFKERCSESTLMKLQETDASKSSDGMMVDVSMPAENNLQKNTTAEKGPSKVHSALEEAIEMLVSNDAIVGLDYILEFKKNISQQGSLPFRCKLCNSAITRPAIIDHIVGSKHRMRYLKAKDESKYEYIVALKIEKSEKDLKIAEAAFELEKLHGRGHVIVNTEEYQKDSVNVHNTSVEEEEKTVETVFTLDKIPIGFEALSPEHDDTHSANFTLDAPLSSEPAEILTDTLHKENVSVSSASEINRVIKREISTDSSLTLPGLEPESCNMDKFSPVYTLNNADLVTVSNKECEVKDVHKSSESFLSNQNKRSASPELSSQAKLQKLDEATENKPFTDVSSEQKMSEIKTGDSSVKERVFSFTLLEDLSKCIISTEEEAAIALQTIDVLLQMLLKYKLQHVPLEVKEKMMSSLQSRSPDKVEELISMLNDSKMLQDKKEEMSVDSASVKLEDAIQVDSEEKLNQGLPNQIKSSDQSIEHNVPSKSTLEACGSAVSSSCSISTISTSNAIVSNANFLAPQTSTSLTYDNMVDVSKNILTNTVVDPICMSQAATAGNSQAANPVCLKPPPFFNWSQTNETANQASYVAAQGNQNIMWATQYQHSQTQYAQMPYYQQQNYGNTFSGTQGYQTQFSSMPQNSMPLKMVANPPLPPPPPPPPPAPGPTPCNPPLPPLPNHTMYSSAATSHSVPLSSNPPHMHTFSKPPPPPPPLP